MFSKKLLVILIPLVICILLGILYPLASQIQGFTAGVLRGLLIGVGMGALLPLAFSSRKQLTANSILWFPVILLVILITYQFLTYEKLLRIPALAFLNIQNANSDQHMIEMSVLTFLSFIIFITRKRS